MKAKDALLLNNTVLKPNPILARRARFWHVASQISLNQAKLVPHFRLYFLLDVYFQLFKFNK